MERKLFLRAALHNMTDCLCLNRSGAYLCFKVCILAPVFVDGCPVSDSRRYQKPFISIVTEYLLLLHKKDALMVPFLFAKESCFSIADTDLTALTWHHLIRMTMESAGPALNNRILALQTVCA